MDCAQKDGQIETSHYDRVHLNFSSQKFLSHIYSGEAIGLYIL